jgi:flavodoxin
MKATVVYDSVFGNTGKIAQAIGQALGSPEDVEVVQAGDVTPEHLAGLALLIVGSPTRQFSPTGATTNFLKSIPKNGLKGVKVAAFDTRFTESAIERVRILAFFVKIFGYAAKPIAGRLENWPFLLKGSTSAIPKARCSKANSSELLTGPSEFSPHSDAPGVFRAFCVLDMRGT